MNPDFKKSPLASAMAEAVGHTDTPAPYILPPLRDTKTEALRSMLQATLEAINGIYQNLAEEIGLDDVGFDADYTYADGRIQLLFCFGDRDDRGVIIPRTLDHKSDKLFMEVFAALHQNSDEATNFAKNDQGAYLISVRSPWSLIHMLRNYMETSEQKCLDDFERVRCAPGEITTRRNPLSDTEFRYLPCGPYLSASAARTTAMHATDEVLPFSLNYLEALVVESQTPAGSAVPYPEHLRAYRPQ